MSHSQDLDDAGLDRAFERIVKGGEAKLNQEAVVRLVLLLANMLATQDETVQAFSQERRPSRDQIDELLHLVENNRNNFKQLVVEIAESVPGPVSP